MAINIDVNEIRLGLKTNGRFEKNYGPFTLDEVTKVMSILAGSREVGYNCQAQRYEKDGQYFVGYVISKDKLKSKLPGGVNTAATNSVFTDEVKADIDSHAQAFAGDIEGSGPKKGGM